MSGLVAARNVTRLVEGFTLGSSRPFRRLATYYVVLGLAVFILLHFFPFVAKLFAGEAFDTLARTSRVLEDGLTGVAVPIGADFASRSQHAVITMLVFMGTIALMLPVSWVYMSTRDDGIDNQGVVQTLVVLPLVVAGIVLVVRDSLALAFSLAGVVAAVRFRTSLSDARDVVYIFLAIAVGFAAGVHALMVAVLLSMTFNVVLLIVWRSDFGHTTGVEHVADSHNGHQKLRAIVTVAGEQRAAAQKRLRAVLRTSTKHWKLDEVVLGNNKATELRYHVTLRKTVPGDALLALIRSTGGGAIVGARVEAEDAVAAGNGHR